MEIDELKQTIISQYANSSIMLRLIHLINDCIDPKVDFQNFYNIFWNLDTAQGVGLDFWGAVVGLSRFVEISNETTFIGSSLESTELKTPREPTSYKMNDEMYRFMILFKAMTNILYCTAPHINQLLQVLFKDRGRAYFVKSGTMSARYVFEFPLLDVEKAIAMTLLPRPAGVLCDFYEPDQLYTWGFHENDLAPFGQAAFYIGDRN